MVSKPADLTPEDFFVGLGVLVAVKKPVRTCVVVVTVTLALAEAADDEEAIELYSDIAL